jgi:hypothetical protein
MDNEGYFSHMSLPYSKAGLAKIGAGVLGLLFIGGIIVGTLNKKPTDPMIALNQQPAQFGLTTHVHPYSPGENHTLEQFKINIDLLVANKQQWVRVDLISYDIAPIGSGSTINWNEQNLQLYDEAIQYARDKQMQIFLVTNVPQFAREYPQSDYLALTTTYYTYLAKRYKGDVAIWQLFNEPNVHHYRDHHHDPALLDNEAYVANMSEALKTASKAVKSVDKTAKTTTSVSHWIGAETGDIFITNASKLYDAIQEDIDVLALNLFPDRDTAEMKRLSNYIEYFQKRYKKPVIVGEIGVSTKEQTGFTEAEQAAYMSLAIQTLKTAKVHPSAILFYELMDETNMREDLNHEKYYGLLKEDGSKKTSFDFIMTAMQGSK